jgi:hypothetical protein
LLLKRSSLTCSHTPKALGVRKFLDGEPEGFSRCRKTAILIAAELRGLGQEQFCRRIVIERRAEAASYSCLNALSAILWSVAAPRIRRLLAMVLKQPWHALLPPHYSGCLAPGLEGARAQLMTDARREQRLKRLSQQIANGKRLIANQMEIISGLERAGQPIDQARFLLAGLQLLQAAKIDCQNKLLNKHSKNVVSRKGRRSRSSARQIVSP